MSLLFTSEPTWLVRPAIICSIALLCLSSCRQKPGDPQKFTELTYDQLTENNVPKGLMFRNNEVRLAEGYDLVYTSDSTMAMINIPGRDEGETAMRCECDRTITIGCIIVSRPIFTCRSLLCPSCKPVLQIYDGPIKIDQFRK